MYWKKTVTLVCSAVHHCILFRKPDLVLPTPPRLAAILVLLAVYSLSIHTHTFTLGACYISYIYIHTHINTHIHTHTHVYTHVYTHTGTTFARYLSLSPLLSRAPRLSLHASYPLGPG